MKDSGLPRIRLHDLRHTHATLALDFAMDIYSHAIPSVEAEAEADLVRGDAWSSV